MPLEKRTPVKKTLLAVPKGILIWQISLYLWSLSHSQSQPRILYKIVAWSKEDKTVGGWHNQLLWDNMLETKISHIRWYWCITLSLALSLPLFKNYFLTVPKLSTILLKWLYCFRQLVIDIFLCKMNSFLCVVCCDRSTVAKWQPSCSLVALFSWKVCENVGKDWCMFRR
jgi:hypothetical protein